MKKLKYYAVVIVLFFSAPGCKKFVELGPPTTLLTTRNVFERDETANAALTGLYTNMVEQNLMPFRLAFLTGIAADELNTSYELMTPVYQNALQPIDAQTNTIWTDAFNFIFQANAIYEGAQASLSLTPSVKKQVMAEAMFIRAFWNFYLINLYGDIPLITTTNYKVNAVIARSSTSEIYELIISDLVYARNNLNESYVTANSITTTTDRVRPNKAAATALLARAYLFNHKYMEAEEEATIVINQLSIFSIVGTDEIFLSHSKEAIWQLAKAMPNNVNTYEGASFILTSAPILDLQKSSTLTTQLLNAFEAGDKRKDNWVGTYTDVAVTPSKDYYYPFKYKVDDVTSITERSTVLRLAEQYLIRAEARAQQNNLEGAISDIDIIRLRAEVPLISVTNPGISQGDLLAAILKERQLELFTEWGHRWLDLKRTGTIDDVMTDVAPLKGSSWNTTKQWWPIPQKEIGNDPNLEQNPGYN
jgi:starch-binding outer membrane protein, SusD/RagB family